MIEEKSVISKDGKILSIIIDKDTCIGAASCMVISPETFGIDDASKAYVIDNKYSYKSKKGFKS